MFERFTDDARRVVVRAQEESRLLNHEYIGAEHLLLGLCHDGSVEHDTVRVLATEGVTLAAARRQVGPSAPPGTTRQRGHIPFTVQATQSLEGARGASDRLGQSHIGPAHLLLGLLQVPDNRAVDVLTAVGADLTRLTRAAEDVAIRSEAGGHGEGPIAAARPGPIAFSQRPSRPGAMSADMDRLMISHRRCVEALKRYGRHDPGCDPDQGCTCGLGPLLDADAEQ